MRGLSETFMTSLKSGFLSGITKQVIKDSDLDLEIRDNYINVYYKGNSLLKLTEKPNSDCYEVTIDPKFKEGLKDFPSDLKDKEATKIFLDNIPRLKQNIVYYGDRMKEAEYEQMIIRANNYEDNINSEYFIIDKHPYMGNSGEANIFDLLGFYWDRNHRKIKYKEVPLCLIEVKFGRNQDISKIHEQIQRYYNAIKLKFETENFTEEMQKIFRQKLHLGLYIQDQKRLELMKTLMFSSDISKFQIIIFLIDYNPNSTILEKNLKNLERLPFAGQIRIFFGGFAMWQQKLKLLADL